MDLMKDAVLNLKDLKKLIIDEFDEMLSLGFQKEQVQKNIFTIMSERRQNILFSATMTDDVDAMLERNILEKSTGNFFSKKRNSTRKNSSVCYSGKEF